MKPARLIAVLFMVCVLFVMVAVPFMILGGLSAGVSEMMGHEFKGEPVKAGLTKLDDSYKNVTVSGPVELTWTPAKESSYDITGPESLIKHMRVKASGDDLEFNVHSFF